MRFALVGNHPDGLAMALALVSTGRHEIAYHSGPPLDPAWQERLPAVRENDLEEILADPSTPERWRAARARMLDEKIDLTNWYFDLVTSLDGDGSLSR